jgi:cysteinyl-tRNA synthetase
MLELGGAEMHKSLGNDVSLRNALDTWGRETLLVFFLTAHWHSPIDFSDDALAAARAQAEGFRNAFRGDGRDTTGDEWDRLVEVLEDDFNTAEALAVMHEWRRDGDLASLRRALELLGLGSLAELPEAPADVTALAERRRQAREQRDFGEADRLRAEIERAGWEVRDVADGFQLVPRP